MSQKFKNQNKYEPIPIPLSQWLKEIRVRVVPILVFIICGIIVGVNWTTRVATPDFMGIVYSDKAQLRAPMAGKLADLYIEPFSVVEEGEVLGRLVVADPSVIQAQLAVINAQIEYLRNSREPEIDMERNILNYEGMKMDVMQERIDLASLKIRKQRAQQVYNRVEKLWAANLTSDDEYEQAKSNLELLESEVAEKEVLIDQISDRLENLEVVLFSDQTTTNPTIAAINVQAERLRLIEAELMPREITAPISGVVKMIHKRNGVVVTPGDLIAEIETRDPNFIIGYVRQPFFVTPEVGMEVEVRSRRSGRPYFASEISDLGGHISYIDTLLLRPGVNFETGLPVKIALNKDVDITFTPGEVVDLILKPQK